MLEIELDPGDDPARVALIHELLSKLNRLLAKSGAPMFQVCIGTRPLRVRADTKAHGRPAFHASIIGLVD